MNKLKTHKIRYEGVQSNQVVTMFRYVRKVFFAWVILITFSAFTAYADVEESFVELSESLAEVSKDFNALATSSLEEAAVIDSSIKELSKAIEFVQESLEAGDPDLTLKGKPCSR